MFERNHSPSRTTSVASATSKIDSRSTQRPLVLAFHFDATGRQATDQVSALKIFSVTAVHTNQCKCEGDCPGNRDSDEAPDRILETTTDKDSFIEQQDANLRHTDTRPDYNLKSICRLTHVSQRPGPANRYPYLPKISKGAIVHRGTIGSKMCVPSKVSQSRG